MTTLDANDIPLHLDRAMTWPAGHYFGVYPATVSSNQDPSGQGRVQVHLPWSPDPAGGQYEVWARLATMMAGGNRGTWFIPEVGDEVLVAFLGGDPDWPYVIGALWNGQDQPPESIDQNNDIRSITSRSGIKVTMDDTSGAVTLTLETPGGQTVTMADAGPSIEMSDSNGNSIQMNSSGMTITAASQLTINAPTGPDHDRPGHRRLGHVDLLGRHPVRQPYLQRGRGRHLHPGRRELPMMAESLGWLAPAPLWGEGGIGLESSELLQPFLTELTSDQFVTEFLGVMGAQGGRLTRADLAKHGARRDERRHRHAVPTACSSRSASATTS